ncbi:MAG: TIGR03960 family B12-binding radical SAM protein [Candidatus Latescibacteria bacterium]|nr:TIGR03960 family B12-binding radical SAM protein [Candidatus Latescibacterota bacterium]
MELQLNTILPLVTKPIRYTGGEYNVYIKETEKKPIYFGLLMPEVYEIGMSNYGLKILYSVLNRQKNVVTERAYAPWLDFGNKLKANKIPLYSLESKKPLQKFDILGFSLQSELAYTNVLYMLDLANIPLFSKDRTSQDPLIIAGGPCTVNPLPIHDFIDLFVVGDGEEIVIEIVQVYNNWNRKVRNDLLTELSRLTGVYVPLIHRPEYNEIKKRNIEVLREDDFPYPPLVPICEVVHDRLTIEISRGCSRGCRFCQAGFINRPVRMRSVAEISRLAEQGIRATGWEEMSLLSLSASDYPNLQELIAVLSRQMAKRRVAISLPSMRGEDFQPDLAQSLAEIKKTGLTFAPETASPKLRSLVNKDISEEKIFASIANAAQMGWRNIKLYFMIGLPNEEYADLDAIVYFLKHAASVSPRISFKFSLSPFIPKPHTPLQWCKFEDKQMLKEKIEYLKAKMRRRNTSAKWENPDVSYVQAILARGDQKLNPVLAQVYHNNGIFQDWSEKFDLSLWQNAFEKHGLDVNEYLQEKEMSERLTWDFINTGLDKKFLKREYEKAFNFEKSLNCFEKCSECGIRNCEIKNDNESRAIIQDDVMVNSAGRLETDRTSTTFDYRLTDNDLKPVFGFGAQGLFLNKKFRIKYLVGETYRYAGHLDLVRAIYRTLRRSELPIAYSKGYSPHPVVSFGPPLPVGVISSGEYLDIEMVQTYNGNVVRDLGFFMPHDMRIEAARQISRKTPTLGKSCNLAQYQIVNIPWQLDKDVLLQKKEVIKSIHNIEITSTNTVNLTITIAPKVKLYGVLQELFSKQDDEVRCLNVERKDFYVLQNGKIFSPMEEE